MEEFLQRAKSKLDRSKRLEKVHAVIGPKSCDLDSLISAFTYAYFLDKVSPPGVLCLPVMNIPRTEFSYFTETRFILEELNISESSHIFRDEINLHQLNDEGKLSITLVGSHVLGSEDRSLEAAVVRVINPDEQSDGELGLPESSSSLVLKELLREAPELITQQLAHLLRGEGDTARVKTGGLMGWFWACSCRKSAIHSWVNNPFKDPGSSIREAGSKGFVKE
ncbi:protein prune homolog 2 isoform X1 [Cricetulus griseus]|nr:protein prune homolog 2 isoform X1 [Cricetulus griseus]